MAIDAVVRGMAIRGVGIHGPLVVLHADEQGGRLMPRWPWLGWLLFRDYKWSWSNVRRVDLLRGPFGGVHGFRIVLGERSEPTTKGGLLGPWLRHSRKFVVEIDALSTEDLLTVVPSNIPRANRRGLFVWG